MCGGGAGGAGEAQTTSERGCRHDASVRHAELQRLGAPVAATARPQGDDAIPSGQQHAGSSVAFSLRLAGLALSRRAALQLVVAQLSKLPPSTPSPGDR